MRNLSGANDLLFLRKVPHVETEMEMRGRNVLPSYPEALVY